MALSTGTAKLVKTADNYKDVIPTSPSNRAKSANMLSDKMPSSSSCMVSMDTTGRLERTGISAGWNKSETSPETQRKQ